MSEINKPFLDTIKATNLCTLKEYIYVYPRFLAQFQNEWENNTEIRFIEEQIKEHLIHVEIEEEAQKRLLDDRNNNKYGTLENYNSMIRSFDLTVNSLKAIIEYLEIKKVELKTPQPPTPPKDEQGEVKESQFSVLEWATIFYYADSCKYFNQKNKAENQSFFIDKHSITTSKKSFKNKVIDANISINNIQNYSIEKLNKILPFVKENYSNGIAKIKNDKEYLKINGKNDTDY